jgi:23S rRNA (guanosine2251-2'-O)-methyltransferase
VHPGLIPGYFFMLNQDIYVIAHNIRSLHNVGSIFRTSDSFGVKKIYLTGYTGTPPDPKIAKVALGAENFVEWEQNKSLARVIKKLKAQGVRIAALENNVKYPTILLSKYKPKFPLAVILGEETKGNTRKILESVDDIIEIPMYGQKESLNVSVACGVVLYGLKK